MLAVIETHPVQYHAPVYRSVQQDLGIPVTAIYGSDFSVRGYTDREFQREFAWDTDLLSGYSTLFLARVDEGGGRSDAEVKTTGLRKALASVQPKAVLLLGYSPSFHQWAFAEAYSTRQPILFRGETTDHARVRSSIRARLRDHALRWLYRRCARLLYVGQRSLAHFQRLACPDSQLIFSPYSVDVAAFQHSEDDRIRLRGPVRRRLRIRDDEVAVLFSGKLSARKGPDLLISAVSSLPAVTRERLVLLFLGDGELRHALALAAASLREGGTRFLGFQNQSQLSQYYHAADLLALPSVSLETWGLVVNEALHHGLPCVVSDRVGCAPDLIMDDETGVAAEAGSVPALAAAIERALTLTQRPEVRAACRQRVDGYSTRSAAEGIGRAYRSVTHPGRQ